MYILLLLLNDVHLTVCCLEVKDYSYSPRIGEDAKVNDFNFAKRKHKIKMTSNIDTRTINQTEALVITGNY